MLGEPVSAAEAGLPITAEELLPEFGRFPEVAAMNRAHDMELASRADAAGGRGAIASRACAGSSNW